jgi:Tfp pilus assembly protein PilV
VKVSKTAIFLFELMVVILVFLIASAACVEIFAGAYRSGAESKDLTMAVLKAESIAEEFKAGVAQPEDDLLFDREWQALTDGNEDIAAYFIRTDVREEDGLREMDISVKKLGRDGVGPQDVYDLSVKTYEG